MTDTTETFSEREEIEMLLPWYVTGTLDTADRSRVETWLARDAALVRQLDLIREESGETIRSNEAIRAPASLSVERMMSRTTLSRQSLTGGAARGFWSELTSLFTLPTPGGLRWAAAAAAVLIVAQSIAIGSLLSGGRPATYQTASGGAGGVTEGTFALVKFADGAPAKDVAAVLAELEMTIVDGPKPGGIYRLRLGPKSLGEAARDEKLKTLKGKGGLVSLATPAP